ncbi:CapA family protein [Paenibacillus thailandensis]|uniref:CapA family protein n=1 Tax=Paenibacillus thailandensis TaxID=393250 RepID=A0ABW5QW15_9BACL
MSTITIAAVGDLLMKKAVIESAREGGGRYDFAPLFAKAAPLLRKADIAIGNLETTLSGPDWLQGEPDVPSSYDRINKRTGYPQFSCPDALAPALKRSGFDVLTTANNHCMDGGAQGLRRTLRVLDRNGLKHTGTYRSAAESKRLLVTEAKGIKVGILSYTYGTNKMPVASSWMVNRIDRGKIVADIARLRKQTDLIVVCMHFGREFVRTPNARQKNLVELLFNQGADIVLGAHPHVVQPFIKRRTKDVYGQVKTRTAVYSLGNFISSRLWRNDYTMRGLIFEVTVRKDRGGKAEVAGVRAIPTETRRQRKNGRTRLVVVPQVPG